MIDTVHSVVYQLLREHGMTTVFGNPGSNELPFLRGLPDDFRYVLALQEGVAVAMADGYAQASGKPVLVSLHSAAGTGNAMGGLSNAAYAHSPLVLMAGQQSRHLVGMEAMLANVDAAQLPRPLVKWSAEPACAADVPRTLSQAIHTASQPAQGPVYVSVPLDDWAQETTPDARHLLGRKVQHGGHPDPAQVNDIARQLSAARNPALVLGPAVDAAKANGHAVHLAERLGCPVWIPPSESRCPFPTNHPAFRATLPNSEKLLGEALADHDLILVVGAPVFRYHQNIPGPYLPEGASLIHVTDDPAEAARAPMGDALVASLGPTLEALTRQLTVSGRSLPAPRPIPERQQDPAGRMHPDNVFHTINRLAPEDAIYVKEATATKAPFWAHIVMRHPQSFYFPAAGGLGFGLPASVGVQMARPDRQVIGLIGDGSANYSIMALWTAAQCEVPVIIVILKNGTYGSLRRFAKLMDAEDAPGLDIPDIDFCALANGYGVEAYPVTRTDELEAALTAAISKHRPALIEVATTF